MACLTGGHQVMPFLPDANNCVDALGVTAAIYV